MIDKLLDIGQIVHFQKNMTLFREGDKPKGMLFLITGSIKVMKYSEIGKEALLYRVNQENICILSASCLIGQVSYNAEGIAEESGKGLFLTEIQFNELLNSDIEFRQYIFSNLASRLADFLKKIDDFIFKSLKERLTELLATEALKNTEGIILKTHQEIAIELGSSREVISRLLKTLEQEKLVELGRNSIRKINNAN